MSPERFTVRGRDGEARLDKVLREKFPGWGRSAVKALLNQRNVKVNGKIVWMGSWKVENGDLIEVLKIPSAKPESYESFDESWLIVDGGDILAVNKPAGLRSQTTRAGGGDNLMDLATARFGKVNLFHRLDRDTSGAVLLTRPGPVNAYLDTVFKERKVFKEYLAIVNENGQLEEKGVVKKCLKQHEKRRDMMQVVARGGQPAKTKFEVLGRAEGLALVRLQPVTGRMHQLRVHMASIGAPIVGDRLYGSNQEQRLMLHAQRITLPEWGEYPMREYNADIGDDFIRELPDGLKGLI